MNRFLDSQRYPIDDLKTERHMALVDTCRQSLASSGTFDPPSFVSGAVANQVATSLDHRFQSRAFRQSRRHNIYFIHFKSELADLPPDHPAQMRLETSNRTLCLDQVDDTLLADLYVWEPFRHSLQRRCPKPHSIPGHPMAGLNVMSYGEGEALNWHFDRSEFTTTLLLQAPIDGGAFKYRNHLRTDNDPNYDGVAHVLLGRDPDVTSVQTTSGALSVFQRKNTAHRVTPVHVPRPPAIAVFSYFDRPGVRFSEAERIGLYGCAGSTADSKA